MNFEEALTYELETIPGLSGKVYPISTPGKGAPYAQYQSSFGRQDKALAGHLVSKSIEGEINLFAKSYGELKDLENVAIALIVGFEQRTIGDDGPFVYEITYEQPVEMFESAPKLHRCVISFNVHI
ncbi:DUF3168 domain-containing protein [Cohnella sp. AR92]|uniref:DUF3168 domain-containing protein n=1 Tax=Cohnella sp. AR92 TaxID=648716 RepID=UPI000F8DBAD4|nr:DUF3168 domain-containing protein [Cohnella sp. AR92]RUS47564.1 DUF3168 domain-containing protein [Cohnella sp. AR92]